MYDRPAVISVEAVTAVARNERTVIGHTRRRVHFFVSTGFCRSVPRSARTVRLVPRGSLRGFLL